MTHSLISSAFDGLSGVGWLEDVIFRLMVNLQTVSHNVLLVYILINSSLHSFLYISNLVVNLKFLDDRHSYLGEVKSHCRHICLSLLVSNPELLYVC